MKGCRTDKCITSTLHQKSASLFALDNCNLENSEPPSGFLDTPLFSAKLQGLRSRQKTHRHTGPQHQSDPGTGPLPAESRLQRSRSEKKLLAEGFQGQMTQVLSPGTPAEPGGRAKGPGRSYKVLDDHTPSPVLGTRSVEYKCRSPWPQRVTGSVSLACGTQRTCVPAENPESCMSARAQRACGEDRVR